MHLKSVFSVISSANAKLNEIPFVVKTNKVLGFMRNLVLELIPVTPKKRLMFQAVAISATALLASSLTPGGTFVATSMGYTSEYISSYELSGDILVSDDDGYLVKINPQTDDSTRIGLTDQAVHTVESGETLSVIAARYEVSMETIMWENGINNANSLRTGQKLMIPPVDGVSYKVKSGDTLAKVAEKYEISAESIVAQNHFGGDDEALVKGDNIFLPGAEPISPPVINVAVNDTRNTVINRAIDYSTVPSSNSTPSVGKIFIYPTKGKITQGYHAGHYAIDIADTSKPPVWAAGGGTVTKSSVGTWGGGYGNHVIIDHGNGIETLYAHLDSVNVGVGQWVSQGDVIGIMGNTGRVYGVTGIHLHWEVRDHGVKQYPGNYY